MNLLNHKTSEMNRYLFLLMITLGCLPLYGQFYEGFEGDVFPPAGWLSFHNGIGTSFNWQGSDEAYVGAGGSAP